MYSMMNKDKYAFDDWANSLGKLSDKEEDFLSESESWVDDNISKIYWEFRDNLSDVSWERFDEFFTSQGINPKDIPTSFPKERFSV